MSTLKPKGKNISVPKMNRFTAITEPSSNISKKRKDDDNDDEEVNEITPDEENKLKKKYKPELYNDLYKINPNLFLNLEITQFFYDLNINPLTTRFCFVEYVKGTDDLIMTLLYYDMFDRSIDFGYIDLFTNWFIKLKEKCLFSENTYIEFVAEYPDFHKVEKIAEPSDDEGSENEDAPPGSEDEVSDIEEDDEDQEAHYHCYTPDSVCLPKPLKNVTMDKLEENIESQANNEYEFNGNEIFYIEHEASCYITYQLFNREPKRINIEVFRCDDNSLERGSGRILMALLLIEMFKKGYRTVTIEARPLIKDSEFRAARNSDGSRMSKDEFIQQRQEKLNDYYIRLGYTKVEYNAATNPYNNKFTANIIDVLAAISIYGPAPGGGSRKTKKRRPHKKTIRRRHKKTTKKRRTKRRRQTKKRGKR